MNEEFSNEEDFKLASQIFGERSVVSSLSHAFDIKSSTLSIALVIIIIISSLPFFFIKDSPIETISGTLLRSPNLNFTFLQFQHPIYSKFYKEYTCYFSLTRPEPLDKGNTVVSYRVDDDPSKKYTLNNNDLISEQFEILKVDNMEADDEYTEITFDNAGDFTGYHVTIKKSPLQVNIILIFERIILGGSLVAMTLVLFSSESFFEEKEMKNAIRFLFAMSIIAIMPFQIVIMYFPFIRDTFDENACTAFFIIALSNFIFLQFDSPTVAFRLAFIISNVLSTVLLSYVDTPMSKYLIFSFYFINRGVMCYFLFKYGIMRNFKGTMRFSKLYQKMSVCLAFYLICSLLLICIEMFTYYHAISEHLSIWILITSLIFIFKIKFDPISPSDSNNQDRSTDSQSFFDYV